MTEIGIVGAGAAAAATAYVIDGARPNADVTILEKSRGVCGRAATRRRDEITYDYGANYVKSDDERVVELLTETLDDEGLVDVTEPIWTFTGDGEISEGRDADEHKWTYRAGLTQIAKRLLRETNATIHLETRAETLSRDDDGWQVTDADGKSWGPFDALVLNPPAPQTADLLDDADWDEDVRADLLDAVRDIDYSSVWTALLHYPFEIDRPYYALINTDREHEIGWVAREECKPGHVPDGESLLVVQAGHEWSADNYDEPADRNVAKLTERTAELFDDERLADPDWTDYQGWRYALPEEGVHGGPVQSAEEHDLYCVGDWVAGEGRVHAALRNGLDTGERIVYRV